jgi:hypothetical protein
MTPLFRSLMAAEFDHLPAPIRELHDRRGDCRAEGRCRIELGGTRLARVLARLMLLPPEGNDVALTVSFGVRDGVETWRRNFAGAVMTSRLQRGAGGLAELVIERRFPVTAAIRLVADAAGVTYRPVRCWLFGVRLPPWLQPRVAARESVVHGRFHFDVEIGAPLFGRIIRYRGWLCPASLEKAVFDLAPGNQALAAPSE